MGNTPLRTRRAFGTARWRLDHQATSVAPRAEATLSRKDQAKRSCVKRPTSEPVVHPRPKADPEACPARAGICQFVHAGQCHRRMPVDFPITSSVHSCLHFANLRAPLRKTSPSGSARSLIERVGRRWFRSGRITPSVEKWRPLTAPRYTALSLMPSPGFRASLLAGRLTLE